MRYRLNVRYDLAGFATLLAIALSGCGNSCFFAFSNNGSGGLLVKAGDFPQVCSGNRVNGTMRAVIVKSPECETCTPGRAAKHLFLTVRGIQVRPSGPGDAQLADWLEIAPGLQEDPLQIELLGDARSETLLQEASIRPGTYGEVRVQFSLDSPADAGALRRANPCGDALNCVILADGRREPVDWASDEPELRIPAMRFADGEFVVLPGSKKDLRLAFELRRELHFSGSEGWKSKNVVLGQLTVVPQPPGEPANLP